MVFLHVIRVFGGTGLVFQALFLQKRTCNAVADRACLACNAAAMDVGQNIELTFAVDRCERLTNDDLQSLKAEVLINILAVDSDLAGTGSHINSRDRLLSAACAVISC